MANDFPIDPLDEDIEVVESDQALDIVQDTLETFFEAANVSAVYGEPVENGDHLVIPTAEILSVAGFGVGSGYGSGGDEEEGGSGSGAGGGGGGRVLARPVAVIISSPEGVRVEPVVDITKIALAALTAGGFMAAMVMGFLNPSKALRNLQRD